ncbi:TrlF family AAA-like ATPase [Syntrophotalea acetylenica]|jgi:DNA repair ATPase RecN|uniref:TrlF family AAA-like ATPase n=1 Tax=Syntrophotalea acetylenica TaxID=29542 RepID=UPI002A364951|nr:AAA family ATPase [Syntrophotalea acetylenica]MDY0263193.1 AAA family ATPase [Syntrophotalea acetylenica]
MTFCYKGMRWLKCDLQMQTPADARHWAGDRLEAGQEAAAAKAFAEACYEKGLDVVGITDHNFLSKDFIPHLQTAFDEIDREFSHKITLFPGFEFEAAGVGRGVHVLCLFEPGTDLTRLDSILTECGVSYPRVNAAGQLEKSDKNLKEILRITQDKYGGIVIMPHATSNDGIFDSDSIAEWLQQDQFTNPDLLAVEVPKPVHLMSAGYQRLLRSGDDCQPGWKRIRPIATLMSSDNKKLVDFDEHQKPTPNSIGYRYSWFKMSEPSIESLRQAFLDHESRIILPEDVTTDTHPAQRVRQATIKSISIKNVAFLADQQVHFSPNMNCVIGGRGSGKSTLLEYLRIILGKDKSKDLDYGTKERIKRVRDTLNEPRAEVEVCWVSADGVEDRIVWQNGSPTVQGRDLADPETFFNSLPLRFYSQQQLNRLTESKIDDGSVRQAQRLLELVDGFTKNELDELADREHKLKLQIQDAFSNLRKAKTLEKDYKRLQQEHQELDRQWKARSEIQEDARQHQLLKAEARYLEGLAGTPGKQFTDVASLAETIAASHVAFQVTDSTHAAWFRQFDDKVKAAKDSLARTIRDAVEQFEAAVEDLKTNDPAWNAIREELDQADAKFSEACAAKGLTTDDVGHLQEINQSRTKKQREIDETGAEIQRLKEAAGDTGLLMQQLHQIWRDQFQKRVEAAERANELAVLNEGRQRFIEVSAKYQQDYKNFRELWQSFAPSDGRTRLGKNWESCGETLYTLFTGQEDAESPWQVLEERLSVEQGSTGPDFGSNSQDLFQHIQDNLERWEKLRCSRVQDTVDMKLFRADGSTAGSIAEGSLSDGQRNTAALALLLAQEGGPLVIDQPEDELDSNFVFRELIPMLRKVKSKRQLIMATHNANLPVNGDAELVYAFEARDGKGEALACGGLDQASVTKAVLDIMEGTEEAFRRRREKYHF